MTKNKAGVLMGELLTLFYSKTIAKDY